MPTDAWTLYASTRDRVIALVQPLTDDEVEAIVPLTPDWSIRSVVAHVCGLNADIAAGMREGLGSDERTTHQVETRRDRSIGEVCEEWLVHGQAMRDAIDDNEFLGRRLTADLVVHLHDLQHALGQPIDPDDEATISGGRAYAARTPDRLAELTSVGVAIELSDGSRFEPADQAATVPVAVVLRASPYDFLRSVTGRRSRREVEALDWSGDPSTILDQLSPYGPLRSTDAGI